MVWKFDHEKSLLHHYGYQVGAFCAKTKRERHKILHRALLGPIPSVARPEINEDEWGENGSAERYRRILSFFDHEIVKYEFRDTLQYKEAISDLKADRDYFQGTYSSRYSEEP